MTPIEAREAVAAATALLGVKGTLEVLIEHAEAQLEAASGKSDQLARMRAASDHRALIILKDKVTT